MACVARTLEPMSVDRVFLGWDRPCLSSVTAWLLQRWGGDLSGVTVGVPGPRAAERLLQLLVEAAQAANQLLRPPNILIGESLLNRMLPAGSRIVPQALRQLAWIEALQTVDAKTLSHLTSAPPDPGDLELWAAMGDRIERLHTEVASAGLRFADVAERGTRLVDFDDADRWIALQRVLEGYLATLDDWGLADPQQARLAAIEKQQVNSIEPLVLVGWFDLSRVLRLMLQQQRGVVHALVFAPDALTDRFDDFGGAMASAWSQVSIDLQDEQLRIVSAPADQADAVVEALADLGSVPVDDVTLGLADVDLAPWVHQHLSAAGQRVESAAGQATPIRLLAAMADVLENEGFTYGAVAALCRHPDLESYIRHIGEAQAGQWISDLDRGHAEHLPSHLRVPNAAGADAQKGVGLFATMVGLCRLHRCQRRMGTDTGELVACGVRRRAVGSS